MWDRFGQHKYSVWGGGGGQNGVAYSGLSFWVDVPFPLRELLQGNLETSLNPNHKYDCSFWIYLPDSFLYAVRNVGIYFSKTSLPVQSNTNSYFQYIPQVKYNGTSYLTEKNKWKQISGSFIADGGEKFLTIGNFDSNALTDTMRVTGGTNYNEWRQAYYYIDNISVIEDTSYHPIGIEEEQIVRISIAIKNGYLQTQGLVFEKQTTQVKLYNLEGKLGVEVFTSPTQREVPIQNLSEGVYFYSIEALGKVVKRGKVVVGL